jgi:hypothetical protein
VISNRPTTKLLDPRDGYKQAVYFAYGRKADFKEIVRRGFTMAVEEIRAHTAGFVLPVALYILVLENPRRRGGMARDLWEADLSRTSSLDDLIWNKIPLEEQRQCSTTGFRHGEKTTMDHTDELHSEHQELYISRHDAGLIDRSAMEKAGIPLRSTSRWRQGDGFSQPIQEGGQFLGGYPKKNSPANSTDESNVVR